MYTRWDTTQPFKKKTCNNTMDLEGHYVKVGMSDTEGQVLRDSPCIGIIGRLTELVARCWEKKEMGGY